MGTLRQRSPPIALLALLLAGCATAQLPPPPIPADWRGAYDLDGDGVRDVIESEFSGGGHCCYRFGAFLSSRGKTVMAPFWFDGGYEPPMDLIDRPERFAIRSDPSGLPEIFVEIATCNGRPELIEPEWVRRYGVRSHCIAVSFAGGRVRVRNLDERVNEDGGLLSCPWHVEDED